jgi:hypothetical protein
MAISLPLILAGYFVVRKKLWKILLFFYSVIDTNMDI